MAGGAPVILAGGAKRHRLAAEEFSERVGDFNVHRFVLIPLLLLFIFLQGYFFRCLVLPKPGLIIPPTSWPAKGAGNEQRDDDPAGAAGDPDDKNQGDGQVYGEEPLDRELANSRAVVSERKIQEGCPEAE